MPNFLKRFTPVSEEGHGWKITVVGSDGTRYQMRNISVPQRAEEDGQVEIEFSQQFDVIGNLNVGEVKIYNLLPEAIDHFEKGKLMVLEAGWLPEQDSTVLSLNPTIERVLCTRVSDTGLTLDILFTDSSEIWLTKMTNRHFPPGVKASTVFEAIIDDLSEDATLIPQEDEETKEEATEKAEGEAEEELKELEQPIVLVAEEGVLLDIKLFKMGKFSPAEDPVYERRGKTFFRPAWMALEELARDMNSKLYVNNRQVFLLPKEEGIPTDVLLDDGSEGYPIITRSSRIHEETDGFYKNEYEGFEPADVRIQTFLNPDIGPDSIVDVKHTEIGGRYRVIRGQHWGSGSDFFTEFDAVLQERVADLLVFEEDEADLEAEQEQVEAAA